VSREIIIIIIIMWSLKFPVGQQTEASDLYEEFILKLKIQAEK
jgi:hypothetical protein